ncbi:MAG: hypothetical protein PVH36_05145 [Desulfobacterales bacterium]|jgi:hypothetical protein
MTTSPDSGLDAILSSKKDLILDKLSMLAGALVKRRQIQYEIFKDIEKDSVWCQNELFALLPDTKESIFPITLKSVFIPSTVISTTFIKK